MESKIKLLRVLDILSATNESSPITASKICEKLAEEGISAERKSVCRDINTLIKYGYKISLCRDNKLGYFMIDGKPAKTKTVTVSESKPSVRITLEYAKENDAKVEKIFGKKTGEYNEEASSAEFSSPKDELFSKLLLAGGVAQIIAPEKTREEFISLLDTALADYNKPKSAKKIEVWLL